MEGGRETKGPRNMGKGEKYEVKRIGKHNKSEIKKNKLFQYSSELWDNNVLSHIQLMWST